MFKHAFFFTAFLMLTAGQAYAELLPISRDAYGLGLPEGTGQDMERIEVMGDQEDFVNGTYKLTFRSSDMKLTSRNLPPFSMRQNCNFQRVNGGRVGDYKPKSMQFQIIIEDPHNRRPHVLWSAGEIGQDYNENPVLREFDLNRRGTRIEPSWQALNVMRSRCLDGRSGRKTLFMTFKSEGLCRWKPENWHKPGHFPFEYRPQLDAKVQTLIYLECI